MKNNNAYIFLFKNVMLSGGHKFLKLENNYNINLNINKLKIVYHNIIQMFKYNILAKDNNRVKDKLILAFGDV